MQCDSGTLSIYLWWTVPFSHLMPWWVLTQLGIGLSLKQNAAKNRIQSDCWLKWNTWACKFIQTESNLILWYFHSANEHARGNSVKKNRWHQNQNRERKHDSKGITYCTIIRFLLYTERENHTECVFTIQVSLFTKTRRHKIFLVRLYGWFRWSTTEGGESQVQKASPSGNRSWGVQKHVFFSFFFNKGFFQLNSRLGPTVESCCYKKRVFVATNILSCNFKDMKRQMSWTLIGCILRNHLLYKRI